MLECFLARVFFSRVVIFPHGDGSLLFAIFALVVIEGKMFSWDSDSDRTRFPF